MRVDFASRSITASPAAVVGAFAEAGAMERWLPPTGMTGEMLRFDVREGGPHRMRLAYVGPNRGRGTSTEDADIVPDGSRAEDHEAAMRASLVKLARFVEEAIA